MEKKVVKERYGREFWAKARISVLKRWEVGSGTKLNTAAAEEGRRQSE